MFVSPLSYFFEHGFIGLTRMLRSVGGTVFQTGLSVLLRLWLLTVLFRLRLLRHVQNLSRITRMRRILSFSRISFNPVLPLDIWFTTDCFCAYTALDSLQQEIIRERTNPLDPLNPWLNEKLWGHVCFFRTRIYRIDTDVCCLSANPLDLLIRWILALPHPSLEWLFFGYG